MVTKRKPTQKHVKVGNLKLKKETVKELSKQDAKAVRGGQAGTIRLDKTSPAF